MHSDQVNKFVPVNQFVTPQQLGCFSSYRATAPTLRRFHASSCLDMIVSAPIRVSVKIFKDEVFSMKTSNRSRCFLSLAITMLFAQACLAGDWRQFRGPGGLGASAEMSLPLTWSEEENLAWKIELPGYGSSSPITLGDRIYVTCYSGYGTGRGSSGKIEDLTLHVVCANRADGAIVWDEHVKPELPESTRVRDHGYAGPTPCC